MVGSKKFVVGTLCAAIVISIFMVFWVWIAAPTKLDLSKPLEFMTTLTTILAPVALTSVMFSLLVQWATYRGSAETLSKQAELHEKQAELVQTATSAYADQVFAMSNQIDTLRKQATAATAQSEAIQAQSEKTSELILALESAAKDQRAQNEILIENIELEKAQIVESNFIDALIANALRCEVQRSGSSKNMGSEKLIPDRADLLEAKSWGSFSVTTQIFRALENFHSELLRTARADYRSQWAWKTADSCAKTVGRMINTVSSFRKYAKSSSIDLVNARDESLVLEGLETALNNAHNELGEISRFGQSQADSR